MFSDLRIGWPSEAKWSVRKRKSLRGHSMMHLMPAQLINTSYITVSNEKTIEVIPAQVNSLDEEINITVFLAHPRAPFRGIPSSWSRPRIWGTIFCSASLRYPRFPASWPSSPGDSWNPGSPPTRISCRTTRIPRRRQRQGGRRFSTMRWFAEKESTVLVSN